MYNYKMRLIVSFFIFLLASSSLTGQDNRPVLQDINYTAVVEQKMKLESKLEKYVNSSLAEILGPGKASIKLDITPNAQKSRVETESWAKQSSNEGAGAAAKAPGAREFLPGIPMKQDIVQKDTNKNASGQASGQKRSIESIVKVPESFIKKINATLVISNEYPAERYIWIKQFIIDVLGINSERGDKFIIRKVRFSPFRKLYTYLTNAYFYLALLIAFLTLIFFSFLLSIFDIWSVFRGPLSKIIGKPKFNNHDSNIKQVDDAHLLAENTKRVIHKGTPVYVANSHKVIIGIGDFIIYSILMYSAMIEFAMIGLIISFVMISGGIIITFYLLKRLSPLPGLPIPVFLTIIGLILLKFLW